MPFPLEIGRWYMGLVWTVAILAGGMVLWVVFYAIGEHLRVLVDIERNTRPANVEGRRYWALPLMGFVFDLMGLILILAAIGMVAWLWLSFTGVIAPPPTDTQPAM